MKITSRAVFTAAAVSILTGGILLPGKGVTADTGFARTGANSTVILESVRQNYLANQRLEMLRAKNHARPVNAGESAQWLKKVKASDVNMVTNLYSDKQQDEINISGEMYYASGDAYLWTIRHNSSLRFAKDPATGATVDKAKAVIYADASGKALYFESEDTYRNFIGWAGAAESEVIGYSPAR